jgi:DNA repair exonuclease SbcCD ATPase subunit
MKVGLVEIINFLAIENASINLADRGLHHIQGVNEDDSSANSNGSGKSSLSPDPLLWCLFGRTSRDGLKADEVVNDKVGKNCMVRVTLLEGSVAYIVTRYRKHAVHKNALMLQCDNGGSVVDMTRTEPETQKLIEQILGSNMDVFMASTCSAQERMPDLPRMTDRPLKVLVEEASGLSAIERAYSIAGEDLKKAEAALAEYLRKQGALMAALVNQQATRAMLVTASDTWDAEKNDKLTQNGLEVQAAQRSLQALQLLAASDASKVQEAQREVDEATAQLSGITSMIAAAQEARREATRLQRLVDVQGLNAAKAAVERARDALQNVHARVGTPCSECGKPLEAGDLETARKHLAEELEKAENHYATKATVVRAAAVKAKEATLKAEAAEAAIPDSSALNAVIAQNTPVLQQAAANSSSIKEREKEVRRLQAERATLLASVNPNAAMIADVDKKAAEIEREIDEGNKHADAMNQAVLVAQHAAKAFAPDGVRAEILDTVTPYLNERTAHYLGTLSDGNITAVWTTLSRTAAGATREKFCIEVSDRKGAKSFAGLSGGEKRKARLATALALQDLTASRATKPLDLWIGDEIDDALDPAGLERLMSILEEKARQRGTVVVISHSDLSDWIDNVTTVRKSGGVSNVEGSLCDSPNNS